MGVAYSQVFPPRPPLTEANLPSQAGRVFIVTGGYSGVGFELSRMLYHAGARVYIAGRSPSTAETAITKIKESAGGTPGQLEFLHVDLADLSTVKPMVEAFRAKETKLDVLINNAAVSLPPAGSKSVQGHELQLATNVLGHYLLTKLLLPLLESSASASPPASTRVVFSASQMVDFSAPKGGFTVEELTVPKDQIANYTLSKTLNWALATSFHKHLCKENNILCLTQNPGNLKTPLLRHAQWMQYMVYPLLYHAKFGAYTELWAACSPELNMDAGGAYVLPWGRLHPAPRPDLVEALNDEKTEEFWSWCESVTKEFA